MAKPREVGFAIPSKVICNFILLTRASKVQFHLPQSPRPLVTHCHSTVWMATNGMFASQPMALASSSTSADLSGSLASLHISASLPPAPTVIPTTPFPGVILGLAPTYTPPPTAYTPPPTAYTPPPTAYTPPPTAPTPSNNPDETLQQIRHNLSMVNAQQTHAEQLALVQAQQLQQQELYEKQMQELQAAMAQAQQSQQQSLQQVQQFHQPQQQVQQPQSASRSQSYQSRSQTGISAVQQIQQQHQQQLVQQQQYQQIQQRQQAPGQQSSHLPSQQSSAYQTPEGQQATAPASYSSSSPSQPMQLTYTPQPQMQTTIAVQQAELYGRVTSIDKKDRNFFKVHTAKLNREFRCQCEFFCPLREGDAIYGLCRVVSHPNFGELLYFIRPPFVQMAMDKHSIVQFFLRVLRGTGFGAIKAEQLFRSLESLAGGEAKVTNYISDLSISWHDNKEPSTLNFFRPTLNDVQATKLLNWWYRNRDLRRLYLLGLTNKQIREANMPLTEMYNRCLENPYTIVSLPIEKCDEIYSRVNKQISAEDRKRAQIARTVYDHMINRSWVGVPSRTMGAQYPDFPEHKAHLEKDYGMVCELFTVYLERPHKVETFITQKLMEIMNDTIDDRDHADPHFLNPNLDEDQKRAVAGALATNVSIVTGSAGTGKTTIIREIIHNLELREIPYAIASFTGKAVSRIRQVIRRRTPATMHRMIAGKSMTPNFAHLILDETSMVTTELLYLFLKTYTGKYRITFIGDHNQLEPIGWGSLFEQMIRSNAIPIFRLNHVHRTDSGNGNGILINANKIIEYADDVDGELPPFEFEETSDFRMYNGTVESVFDVVKALHDAGVSADKITVVTPFNRELPRLNQIFQQIYNDGMNHVVDSRKHLWMVGDRVMMTENNYDINVMNGEEGIVTDIAVDAAGLGDIRVTFQDGGQHDFKLEPTKLTNQTYGEDGEEIKSGELTVESLCLSFGVSVHRSQGSEWDFVIVYLPDEAGSSSFLNRRLIYVALTRAKLAVWCIGDILGLTAAATRAPAWRCDNLAVRLRTAATAAANPEEGREVVVATADEQPMSIAPTVSQMVQPEI